MKIASLPLLIAACIALPALAQTRPSAPTAPPARCMTLNEVSGTMTPVDLTRAMIVCINQGKDQDAVDLYNIAGAFAKFDTMRVSDRSAHAAYPALKVQAGQVIGEAASARFNERLKAYSGIEGYHQKLCQAARKIAAPSYEPTYMTNHGMGAFTGAKQTVDGFTPVAAWMKVQAEYLKCSQ